ncbi:MAG TPA: Xaa-Pro peptidase family protein, partial [Methanomicrobiales archaeon]|nr:Xaa-Pro peptidase family protein [Methanomicrobiales archaeon]
DPVPFIKRAGQTGMIIVSQMEYARAVRESAADAITRAEARLLEYMKEEDNPRKALARAIAGLVEGDVLVPPNFPYALAVELQNYGKVLVDADTVESMRAVKSPEEIALIEKTQRATESAMERAISLIRSSVPKKGVLYRDGSPLTSEQVRHAMHVLLLDAGYQALDTIVSCGEDTAIPHVKGSGPLRADEPIVIDVFPRDMESGYFADMTRTVVKGEADTKIREMYAAVRDAKSLASSEIRAGASGADVHQQVVDFFKDHGYTTDTEGFIHNLGHGVGLEVHELPILGPRGKALTQGNVVTVEPGLYYRNVGGVRLEDMGIVMQDGFDCITKYKVELEV